MRLEESEEQESEESEEQESDEQESEENEEQESEESEEQESEEGEEQVSEESDEQESEDIGKIIQWGEISYNFNRLVCFKFTDYAADYKIIEKLMEGGR